ncbi:GNAT family N-acetyltransferase [Nocardioides hwasunensis]|uniref:GNAT family N-acetyltransferase n=1 Tax=Nocardioides hwasunensis TaxID=397258 RepID=A0ABR8MGH1_9ACTN|nr:GNAT family N-acetyltransferase [Nocardioides hwasunensis]MBD3914356.1 GNAT family N-acetyltransferase [Nocardioides hwasunensis]
MRILPATVEDAEALSDLQLDAWEEAYADLLPASVFAARRAARAARVERWHDIISAGSSANLLAWSPDGRLVGFSSTGPGRDSPDDTQRDGRPPLELPALELMALYVRATAYGSGVGFALLQAAIGAAEAYLWVLDGNERAIRFYERQGFRFNGAAKPDDVGLERRMVRRSTEPRGC